MGSIMFVRESNDEVSHIATGWKAEAKCGARPVMRGSAGCTGRCRPT